MQHQEAQESPNLTQQAVESPNLTQQAEESPNLTQQAAEPPNSTQQAAEPPNSTQQAAEPPDSTQVAPESSSPNSTRKMLHVPKLVVILSSVFCCMFLCSKHNQLQETLFHLLALWNLIHLLSLGVLPTMIWAFVLPLRIISLITSIWAILFCLTAAVAVFIYSISSIGNTSQRQQSGINQCCSICHVFCLVAIPPLFLVILVLGTVIYLRLIMTSIDATTVAGIIASFLPTAALTIIGWVVSGRVLIGVSVEGESASQDTSHQSNTGGRMSNIIKHLPAFRGTTK